MEIKSAVLIGLELGIIAYACLCWHDFLALERAIHEARDWVRFEADVYYMGQIDQKGVWGNSKTVYQMYAHFVSDGREFGAYRINFGRRQWVQARSWARRMRDRDKVTIYANPERPHQNVGLDPKRHPRIMPVVRAIFWSCIAVSAMLMVMPVL